MKTKSKITALLTVILMLFAQMPFTAFAAETDTTDTTDTSNIRAELLSPDTLPNGKVDTWYKKQFTFDYSQFNDGFMAYSWSIPENEIPPGLELVGQYSTWQPTLQGTPTKAGTYIFTIEGARTDYKNGEYVRTIAARKTYTLTILPNPLKISTDVLLNGNENTEYWSKAYEDDGRTVTWSMTLADGTELPEGLTINSENGEINWKKPEVGKYNLKITATSTSKGESTSRVLRLVIEPGDGCTHTAVKRFERKHATCKENGMADYWYCDTCEKYFLNEECTRETKKDSLDKFYTIGFHSDKIGKNSESGSDGFCDTCGKAMPIFKRVTDEKEITSGGMYLVVSKIGDEYYTLKAPAKSNNHCIEATTITKNSDGTFSYPESDSDVMILKTEFAAECGALDAGKPRYSLATTVDGIPYTLSSDDYSGSVQMYSYENSKYGYRLSLLEDGTPAIASVYAEYWGSSDEGDESGKGKGSSSSASGILTAFEGERNGKTERFFSLRTQAAYEEEGFYMGYEYEKYDEASLKTYPIELYKLIYMGSVNEHNYTLSDTQSIVTIDDSEFPVIYGVEGKDCSTVGGIGEAVKTDYVEKAIKAASEQAKITGDVSVTAYADINVKSEDGTVSQYGSTNFNSIVYTITPKIAIKDSSSEEPTVLKIDDENFDGSEMTVSLCVGDMEPRQIIHHKTDGTEEYFYSESSEQAKNGAKSFSKDYNYTQKGDFVTFTVDSFSDIEILAAAKPAAVAVAADGSKLTVTGTSVDSYTVILALYEEDGQGNSRLSNCQSAVYNGKPVSFTMTDDYAAAKVMVWKSLDNPVPVTEAVIISSVSNKE